MAEAPPGGGELPALDLERVARDEGGVPWSQKVGPVTVYAAGNLQLLTGDEFWLGDKPEEEGRSWPGGFDENPPRVWHGLERLEFFVWSIRYGYRDSSDQPGGGVTYVALPATGSQPPQWRRSVGPEPVRGWLWTPVLIRAKRVRDAPHDEAAVITDMKIVHSGDNPLRYSGLVSEYDYTQILNALEYPLGVTTADLWLLAHDVEVRSVDPDRVVVRWSTFGGVDMIDGEEALSINRALPSGSSWVPAHRLPIDLQAVVAGLKDRWMCEL